MATISEAFVSIRPDFSKLGGEVQRGLAGTSAGIKDLGDQADDTSKRTRGLIGPLGDMGKTAVGVGAGFVAFQGLQSVTGFISGTIGAASSMNETLSKSNTIFGSSAREIETSASGAARGFGQSKQGALALTGKALTSELTAQEKALACRPCSWKAPAPLWATSTGRRTASPTNSGS